jgi:hypothetical protein
MLNPQFGSGVLYGIPNAGNLVANPTPMQFGILQEVQLQFKGDLKKLYGQLQMPIAKARGKVDVSGKGKIASLDPMFYAQLYFGQPTVTGVQRVVFNEAATASISTATAQVTANKDLGVIVTGGTGFSPGTQLTAIATGTPTTGQYNFAPYVLAGLTPADYVFAAADVTAGLTVQLSYQWPDTTHGTTLTINNELMGFAPEFQALLYNNFRSNLFAVQLNSCVMGQLSIPTKQEDFWISDFDFDASADAAGVMGYIFADQI